MANNTFIALQEAIQATALCGDVAFCSKTFSSKAYCVNSSCCTFVDRGSSA